MKKFGQVFFVVLIYESDIINVCGFVLLCFVIYYRIIENRYIFGDLQDVLKISFLVRIIV